MLQKAHNTYAQPTLTCLPSMGFWTTSNFSPIGKGHFSSFDRKWSRTRIVFHISNSSYDMENGGLGQSCFTVSSVVTLQGKVKVAGIVLPKQFMLNQNQYGIVLPKQFMLNQTSMGLFCLNN